MPRLLLSVVLVCLSPSLTAQVPPPSFTNQVLELDGNGTYVQLPDDIFKGLTEGTVEAWLNPSHWDGIQRFFNFGAYQDDMGVGRPWNTQSGLEFFSDIHIEVDQQITVEEGHRIGHHVKDCLLARFPTLRDVLVHLEPHPHTHN